MFRCTISHTVDSSPANIELSGLSIKKGIRYQTQGIRHEQGLELCGSGYQPVTWPDISAQLTGWVSSMACSYDATLMVEPIQTKFGCGLASLKSAAIRSSSVALEWHISRWLAIDGTKELGLRLECEWPNHRLASPPFCLVSKTDPRQPHKLN